MSEIHPTQEALLKLLKDNIDAPLTIRELQSALNISSPSTIQHHIEQLEKKGYLKRNPNNPREYKILQTPDKAVVYLNLYGMAKCGPRGFMLDGNLIDRLPIASRLISFSTSEAYLLEAKGDSMEPKIQSSDILIIQHKKAADNGDIVVCVNDSEVLIKRFHKYGKQIILQSENSAYEPFLASSDFRIEGIVRGIIRTN